jgi:hypothetical protein
MLVSKKTNILGQKENKKIKRPKIKTKKVLIRGYNC